MLSENLNTTEYFHQVVRIDTHAEIVLGVVSTPTSYMAPPQLKVREIAVERHSPGALKRQTDAGCQF
jgi:hypothetical protein